MGRAPTCIRRAQVNPTIRVFSLTSSAHLLPLSLTKLSLLRRAAMDSLTLSSPLTHCSLPSSRRLSHLPTSSSAALFFRAPKHLISPLKCSLSSINPQTLPSPDSLLLHLSPTASQAPATAPRGEADPMGLLLKERIVFLGNTIDDFVADAIISQLLLLDAQDSTKDIRLFINSAGGSLSATMAIFDVVRLVRADVSTIALGISASTSSIILGGGTKGKRFAMPNTRIMIHQPLGGASGQAIDVEIQAREVMHNKRNVTKIISEFTGRSYEQVEKDIDRDRYMSPIEAVEYGIIDGIIDRDSIIPLEPVPDKVKSSMFDYVEISKDPKKFLTPDIPDDEIY